MPQTATPTTDPQPPTVKANLFPAAAGVDPDKLFEIYGECRVCVLLAGRSRWRRLPVRV